MENRGLAAFGLIGFTLLTLIVAFSVFGGDGNILGSFAQYLAIGSAVTGLLAPKKSLYYLIILAAYSDLLKRTLILDTTFNYGDILYVRALCPLTLAGIVSGVFIRRVFDRSLVRDHGLALFFVPAFIVLAFVAVTARTAGLRETLQGLADGLSYIMLLFVLPSLFRDSSEIIKLVRFTLWVFVPVALYGVYQQFYGLSDFEIRYLKSGFTMLIKHLDDNRPRPFSTLTDSSVLATVCAVCACFSLMLWRVTPAMSKEKPTGLVSAWMLWFVFVIGCLVTVSRMANMNWLLPLCLLPLLRNGFRTSLMYGGAVLSFALVCVFANDLILFIRHATEWGIHSFGDTDIGEQFARFHTYVPRLDGFHDLMTNPKMWTMFGYGPQMRLEMLLAGDVHSHDIVSNFLLDRGWVALFLALGVVAFLMVKMHQAVFRLRGAPEFELCLWLLAINGGLIFHDLFGGDITGVFPANYFFWCNWAMIVTLVLQNKPQAAAAAAVPERLALPRPLPGAYAAGRLRPALPVQFKNR